MKPVWRRILAKAAYVAVIVARGAVEERRSGVEGGGEGRKILRPIAQNQECTIVMKAECFQQYASRRGSAAIAVEAEERGTASTEPGQASD